MGKKKKKKKKKKDEEGMDNDIDTDDLPAIPPIHNVLIDLRTLTTEEEEVLQQVVEKDELETRALDKSVG